MNYFPLWRESRILKKAVSMFALVAFVAGAFSGIAYTSSVHANNGINTTAVPNTGTLTPGQNMEVHMTVTLDPNDTNPITSPSCTVNGVDVTDTFTNLTTGSDGHFRFIYTVGSGDASRVAGQVPINCTIEQTGSVTVTAFDDGNTVAIDTTDEGSGTTTPPVLTPGADGVITYFNPSSGTLSNGQSLELNLEVGLDPNDTNPVTSPSCLVNGVDVASSFQNLTTGSDGHFRFTYTVGANDSDRSAGQVPISCTIQQTGSVTVTALDDANTVAIDATASGTAAPTITAATISPNTGSISQGEGATVTLTSAATDLTVTGTCHVNVANVASTFTNAGGGTYMLSYIVGASDGERPAGHIPFACTLGNADGNVTVNAWTDNNTLAIDTNDDGTIDNGTNTLGFTVTANPSSGTLTNGQSLQVFMQDPLPSADVVIGANGCRVNDVNVAGSYTYMGNGLYRVTYTVGSTDADRAAGQIPFDCTLENHTGSVHLTAFTDSNTVAIDATAGGGSGTTTAPTLSAVTANPNTGTLTPGNTLQVNMQSADTGLSVGACTVNGKNVAGSFQNLGSGAYRVTYTVASGDTNRHMGEVPVNCTLTGSNGSVTASAFTDNNTVAIYATEDPEYAIPPQITGVSINPSSGTLSAATTSTTTKTAQITITANKTELVMGDVCQVNNVDVRNSFQNLGGGNYKVTYTAANGHSDRSAGTIPFLCTLRKATIASSTTATAFTDGNTLAIDINGDGIFSTSTGTTTNTGGNGTTTNTGGNGTTSTTTGSIGGDVTGTTTLAVSSITQVESVATAGGGFENGWVWIFNVTVPSNETQLSLRFDDWTRIGGGASIPVAGNMRFSTDQDSSTTTTMVTAAGTYTVPVSLTSDLNSNQAGRQIQVRVEMQVPSNASNGSYTTNYGIRSTE